MLFELKWDWCQRITTVKKYKIFSPCMEFQNAPKMHSRQAKVESYFNFSMHQSNGRVYKDFMCKMLPTGRAKKYSRN